MVHTHATSLLAAAGFTAVLAVPVSTGQDASVVVHLHDYAGVPSDELADARRLVARVYGKDGVRVEWAGGGASVAEADGRLHVDLVVLNEAMTEAHDAGAREFGRASSAAKRAYLYYPRIRAHAGTTFGDPRYALALVMAHELGHLLLPEHSHADTGLMRAEVTGQVRQIPRLLGSQAAIVRALLAAR